MLLLMVEMKFKDFVVVRKTKKKKKFIIFGGRNIKEMPFLTFIWLNMSPLKYKIKLITLFVGGGHFN